jgi:hypothetical protein
LGLHVRVVRHQAEPVEGCLAGYRACSCQGAGVCREGLPPECAQLAKRRTRTNSKVHAGIGKSAAMPLANMIGYNVACDGKRGECLPTRCGNVGGEACAVPLCGHVHFGLEPAAVDATVSMPKHVHGTAAGGPALSGTLLQGGTVLVSSGAWLERVAVEVVASKVGGNKLERGRGCTADKWQQTLSESVSRLGQHHGQFRCFLLTPLHTAAVSHSRTGKTGEMPSA